MQQHATRSARAGARGTGVPEGGHEDRIAETLAGPVEPVEDRRLDLSREFSELGDYVTDLRYLGAVAELVKDDLLRSKHPQGMIGLPDTYECLLLTNDQTSLLIWLTGKMEETGRQANKACEALENMLARQDPRVRAHQAREATR